MQCKAIKEIVKIVDAESDEYEFAKKKVLNEIDFIDLKAREAFPSGVNAVTLKCCYRFNPTRIRDNHINNDSTRKDCPRYGADEIWEYIILCNENHYQRAEFIYNLE